MSFPENEHGHEKTPCTAVREQFALLLYGELSFDEEERIETHLSDCMHCRGALDREKALHAALSSVAVSPPASLLQECRENLRIRLNTEDEVREVAGKPVGTWWEQALGALTLRPESLKVKVWTRPAAALALVAIGFFGARLTPLLSSDSVQEPFQSAGFSLPSSHVRNVESASGGTVRIVLDETRQRELFGDLQDQQIRGLLLAAARDPSDPGLRAETLDILSTQAESAEVRGTMVFVLGHDQNPGVRLRAMEGLKAFAQDPAVRGALEQVLLSDNDDGMRTQAINLLTAGSVEDLDRQIIGTLQELMNHENNSYVRQRSRVVLESAGASPQTY